MLEIAVGMSKTPITSEVTTGLMFHVFKIAVGKS
jgi:hypothetical protein